MPRTTLYQEHTAMREASRRSLGADIRTLLVRFAEQGHCDQTIQGRFTSDLNGSCRKWSIRAAMDQPPGEALRELQDLNEARLVVLAEEHKRNGHLVQFTAMIEGKTKAGADWVVAVHLERDTDDKDADRKGAGACSHAVFHCHVGPNLDARPKVRVPMPAVGAAAALDWLLAQLALDWEPAPWPSVVAKST